MKHVLVITYYWPPAGGPGVQRWLKFCKYLRDYGWEPIVLTVENGSYPYLDESLEEDIPAGLRVVKTQTKEPIAAYNRLRGKKPNEFSVGLIGIQGKQSLFQRFAMHVRANWFVPDARKGWRKYARAAALKLMQEKKIDAVITTGPPHSTHLIGLDLKRKHRLPWLVDFRDPWTNIYYNKVFPRSEKTERKDKSLEDLVLSESDALTVVGPSLQKEFSDRTKRSAVIYNGFDAIDLPDRKVQKTECFTLRYIGNYKPNQDVPTLWRVLAEMKAEITGFEEDFRLEFTGNIHGAILEDLKQLGLSGMVHSQGFVAHGEATRLMTEAASLLFVVPQTENNRYILTGKLFEYLASSALLLPVGPPDGDAAAIIRDAGRGEMADYEDAASLKRILTEQYRAWHDANQQIAVLPREGITPYSRQALTQTLAGLLDQITS